MKNQNKKGGKMKDKILLFIIGVLVGAVVATGAFFIYTKVSTSNVNNHQMPGGQFSMQEGQNGEMGQPPERPDGENMKGNMPQENSQSNSKNNTQNNSKNSQQSSTQSSTTKIDE